MTDIVERLNSGYPSLLAQRNAADEIVRLRQRVEALEAKAEMDYAIIAGDNARIIGLKDELAELRKQSQQVAQAQGEPALKRYVGCDGDSEPDKLERLRFFCSCAMRGQDWLDVGRFFDDISKAQGEPVATVICEPNYWSDGHHHEGYRPYIKEDELGALPIGTKLYTSAPTIPEGWQDFIKNGVELINALIAKSDCSVDRNEEFYLAAQWKEKAKAMLAAAAPKP